MRVRLALVIAALVTGCAAAPRPNAGAPVPPEESFESAFAAVHAGRKTSARAEGLTLEWVGEGHLRILREDVDVAHLPSDEEIARSLRSALRPFGVQVQVHAGVVTLRGWLDSQYDAVRAVRAALGSRGVVAVNAQLGYPVNQAS